MTVKRKMRKIVHFLEVLEPVGGTSVKLRSLVRETKGNLQHVFVCIQRSLMTDEFESLGAKIYVLRTRSVLKLAIEYRRIVRVENPDVIATHFSRSFLVGSLVNIIARVGHIHFEHGPANLKSRSTLFATRMMARLPDRIVCNSEYTRRRFEEHVCRIGDRGQVIYNPVEARGEVSDLDLPGVLIGHVGGLVDWRDQQTLLRAFKMLLDDSPRRIDCRLVIIGDGPEKINLVRLAAELGIDGNVQIKGYQEDLGSVFGNFFMYVNPAKEEGFGIANVEAMLAGVPVILSNAGAHSELIENERTGLYFDVGSPTSLFSAMRRIIEDDHLRKSLALAGRKHARECYTPGIYANSIRFLVDEICEERSH